MWLRWNKKVRGNSPGDVGWVENEALAKKDIKDKKAARLIGPEGPSYEEAAPEDIQKHEKDYEEYKAKKKKAK